MITIIPNSNLFEPITTDNIHELKPGDWIWDNKMITRMGHQRYDEKIKQED